MKKAYQIQLKINEIKKEVARLEKVFNQELVKQFKTENEVEFCKGLKRGIHTREVMIAGLEYCLKE